MVERNFSGETSGVGWYLAAARQAQRDGYGEAAEVLKRIAWEEAEHAVHFAEMNAIISASTRENIKKALAGEQKANKGKREAAVKAKELGIDEAHDYFDESPRDEARHAQMLAGMLSRHFS